MTGCRFGSLIIRRQRSMRPTRDDPQRHDGYEEQPDGEPEHTDPSRQSRSPAAPSGVEGTTERDWWCHTKLERGVDQAVPREDSILCFRYLRKKVQPREHTRERGERHAEIYQQKEGDDPAGSCGARRNAIHSAIPNGNRAKNPKKTDLASPTRRRGMTAATNKPSDQTR